MKWVELKYSKTQIGKAGKALIKGPLSSISDEIFLDSTNKLSNWRAVHAFPMQVISVHLRRNTKLVDKNALIVQRLKRLPSIYSKLMRERGMSLVRMEDIAGCRAIVKNIKTVYDLYNLLRISKSKQIIHRERLY